MSNPILLTHYMPWFVAKPFRKVWGWHWTMNAFDPEKQTGGKRQIASHYYPLIGPYDSGDPVVLEYHLLLMKLAGIEGVVVDWYGLSELFDYPILHQNTQALIQKAGQLGMKFAICYEDQTVPQLVEAKKRRVEERVSHVVGELEWLQKNWFGQPGYVWVAGKPLLLSFGYGGLSNSEWAEVLARVAPLTYLSEHQRRPGAQGAFDWPIPAEFPASIERFYGLKSAERLLPVAFPRFHDCYAEGKAQPTLGRIPDEGGKTLETTLKRALTSGAPVVQLATWNDWGEGTGIEPTQEFGYRDLRHIQTLRGLTCDLSLPRRLYQLRTASKSTAELDQVAQFLANRNTKKALPLLERLERMLRK